MFTGQEIVHTLEQLGVSHVVWVPDSTFGTWEADLEASRRLELLRVCREGEAWPLAAGLQLGGQSPLIMMQTTGLFESGDALLEVRPLTHLRDCRVEFVPWVWELAGVVWGDLYPVGGFCQGTLLF